MTPTKIGFHWARLRGVADRGWKPCYYGPGFKHVSFIGVQALPSEVEFHPYERLTPPGDIAERPKQMPVSMCQPYGPL